jgi:hypothetical protein
MDSMLQSLCHSRSCHRRVTRPLTLQIADVGNLTVEPYEDPPRSVERFAAAATEQGVRFNVETMRGMVDWFCGRRSCRRPLARPWTLGVADVGNLTVHPYQEPAYMVELFAAKATEGGVPFTVETMAKMLEWFCARRSCFRGLGGAHTLRVTDVGNLTVTPTQDPASQVERFAAAAGAAGVNVGAASMLNMYVWFCERRSCFRPLTGPLKLSLEGVGNVTVAANQDPPVVVETFAAAAVKAGAPMDVDTVNRMLDWFCRRRSCHATPTPPLALEVESLGTIVAQPWDEPADAVEHFATLAAEAGLPVQPSDMVDMLTWFCKQRKCTRLQLRPPPTPNATLAAAADNLPALPAAAAPPPHVAAASA